MRAPQVEYGGRRPKRGRDGDEPSEPPALADIDHAHEDPVARPLDVRRRDDASETERSPGPIPRTARPSEISFKVAMKEAMAAGVSVNVFMMPGPILIESVFAAIMARVGYA